MTSPNPSTSPPERSALNIPNALSSLRIVVIPILIYLLYGERDHRHDFWAAILFGFAFVTDVIDGIIARNTQSITRLGRILDPIADKLLVLAALLILIYLQRVNVIVAILLLGREITISGLRSLAASENISIPSITSAKLKTVLEGFGLGFLILGPGYEVLGFSWQLIGNYLIYAALLLAYWSGFIYFRRYFRHSAYRSTP